MPDITNAQAVQFADARIRPMADAFAQAYNTAKALIAEWNALSISSLITNTTDPIRDGANPLSGAADGRSPITGAKATSVVTRAIEFVADYETGDNAKLNTILQVKVNGQAKF